MFRLLLTGFCVVLTALLAFTRGARRLEEMEHHRAAGRKGEAAGSTDVT